MVVMGGLQVFGMEEDTCSWGNLVGIPDEGPFREEHRSTEPVEKGEEKSHMDHKLFPVKPNPGFPMLRPSVLLLALFPLMACGDDSTGPEEGPNCETPLCDRAQLDALGLDPFYQKYVDAGGIPVISSEKVQDEALLIAKGIVQGMLSFRPDLRQGLITGGAYVGIMGRTEVTTDIPEHAHLANDPNTDWNQRARGLGGTPGNPITTAGEENLLCLADDRYRGENILVHEFAHAVHLIGINLLELGFNGELQGMYETALAQGLWVDNYAGSNRVEYWAEGVQSWFDTNQRPQAGIHNEVDTRNELKEYDPPLAGLITEYFGDLDWRPVCPNG